MIELPRNEFIECVRDCFFHQHVTTPTRGRGTDKPSVLDLVFTNEINTIEDLIIQTPLGSSDHSILKITLNCNIENSTSVKTRFLFDKGNYDLLRRDIQSFNWKEDLQQLDSIEEQWDFIRVRLGEAVV